MKATIFNIERFSLHKGPGIRTTVFFQGCPLRCPWCANPESQSSEQTILYDAGKCIRCKRCISLCESNALSIRNGSIHIEREKCTYCKRCEDNCIQNALKVSGYEITINEILDIALLDKDYFDSTKGGITLSGGEALFQKESAIELLKNSKQRNISTAVETCGQISEEIIKVAYRYTDIFLFDIKHLDKEKLSATTGGNIDLIIRNFEYLAGHNADKVVIRVPVIPGFNYDDAFIGQIFDFALFYKVKEVDLLPYHDLGRDKYIKLGRKYEMPDIGSAWSNDLVKYAKTGENEGLIVKIGG